MVSPFMAPTRTTQDILEALAFAIIGSERLPGVWNPLKAECIQELAKRIDARPESKETP